MPIKNTDLKALAYQLKKAKRNHDQTMIDKVEEERRVFHLNRHKLSMETVTVTDSQVSRRNMPTQQLYEDRQKQTLSGKISTIGENRNEEPNAPIVMRMKLLLNDTLLEAGLFDIKCPTEDCEYKISPLRYAVHGPNIDMLSLCCIECAQASNEGVRREFEMDRKRALVYMYHAGSNVQTICAICDLKRAPLNIVTDSWEMGHKVSDKCCGKNEIENLFPAHPACNNEQHMRSLNEIRKAAGFTNPPFPNALASLDVAKKARRNILS